MKRLFGAIFTGVCVSAVALGTGVSDAYAEQIKLVINKVTALGSPRHNASAQGAISKDTGLIIRGTGDQVAISKEGKVSFIYKVSQINIALPAKNTDLSFLQALCVNRFNEMQSSVAKKAGLEFTFDGKRLGTGVYQVNSILGCADVEASFTTAPVKTPTPVATPRPTPRPTPQPTPQPTPRS